MVVKEEDDAFCPEERGNLRAMHLKKKKNKHKRKRGKRHPKGRRLGDLKGGFGEELGADSRASD